MFEFARKALEWDGTSYKGLQYYICRGALPEQLFEIVLFIDV